MKRFFVIILTLCLILCSCAPITDGDNTDSGTGNSTGNSTSQDGLTQESAGTEALTKEDSSPLVPDKEDMEAEYMGQDCFLAYVEGVGAQIEAQCLENQCIFGDVIINISPQTIFKDKDGKEISKSQIKVGDKIKVDFNGVVTRSLPPQVVATQISLYQQ